MLHNLIERRKQQWLSSPDCPMQDVFAYINKTGKMREPQIAAIETYLFLKTEGENRPLANLLSSGFFISEEDEDALDDMKISHNARNFLLDNKVAMSLYKFAQLNEIKELQQEIHNNYDAIDYEQVIRDLFYRISYPDYLMSLPMGAGKTFLIAAIIYLDLYFHSNNPNSGFARNFLVLIPNALKSSIGPSLSNIAKFDPTWILPKETSDKINNNLKFEVLASNRESRKTLQTSNPNALKVMHATRSGFNHIFLVNAEKVILDDYNENESQSLPDMDQKDTLRNELKYSLSKLPELGIFVDEVHHVHTSDHKEIKLRQVINQWNLAKNHNIAYMLGFSGTPYLPQINIVKISKGLAYKMKNITNVVYHYPLYDAVENFLKRPDIKIGHDMKRTEIIEAGVNDFIKKFGDKKYKDGSIAKLVIYCPSIEVLEEEVYPMLKSTLKLPDEQILRYHKGNKKHSLDKKNELDFLTLDTPESPYRFVLLVQVGREGWDCRSLTGVILSQEGDCSKNMVLQTCCRCLREVDSGDEQALVWLNDKNAKYLDQQLSKEQNTSIEELINIKRNNKDRIKSTSRLKYLELDKIEYYQLRIGYENIIINQDARTKRKLNKLSKDIKQGSYKRVIRQEVTNIGKEGLYVTREERVSYDKEVRAEFSHWVMQISKESFNSISIRDLLEYEKQLKQIFTQVTTKEAGEYYWNNSYSMEEINKNIRLSFHKERTIKHEKWHDSIEIDLLNSEKLKPILDDPVKIYPTGKDAKKILEYDAKFSRNDDLLQTLEQQFEKDVLQWAKDTKKGKKIPMPTKEQIDTNIPILNKDRSFHYIPHDFSDSNYEKKFFQKTLLSPILKDLGVEVYYNGNRHLGGVSIECYVKSSGKDNWHRIGNYTTDFLLIKRDKKNKLHKVMLIETKGEIYSHSPEFQSRRKFVDEEFVTHNNKQFGYEKFKFMCFVDSEELPYSISRLEDQAKEFFTEN